MEPLGKTLTDFFIEYDACKIFKEGEPGELLQIIFGLPSKSFITPNYDTLIEKLYLVTFGEPITSVLPSDTQRLREIMKATSSDFIFKNHGCINQPESIVLDGVRYRQIIHSTSAEAEALKAILNTRLILFIGAGLNDPDFNHFKDATLNLFGEHAADCWAFMPSVTPEQIEHARKHRGVNIISYDVTTDEDGEQDHSDLKAKIRLLIQEIEKYSPNVTYQTTAQEARFQEGALDNKLAEANERVSVIDKMLIGFVAISQEAAKDICKDFVTKTCNCSIEIFGERANFLVQSGLIKATENFFLTIDEEFSKEAAAYAEDAFVRFLAE
nr:SIR2 family protein [Aliamphritea spongicola]